MDATLHTHIKIICGYETMLLAQKELAQLTKYFIAGDWHQQRKIDHYKNTIKDYRQCETDMVKQYKQCVIPKFT